MDPELERRLLTGIYLQLSLVNRADPKTAGAASAVDQYVREWLSPKERALLEAQAP